MRATRALPYVRIRPHRIARARALVVDHRHDTRSFTANILHHIGIREIALAGDGSDALEKVMLFEPDLMLTAWELPYLHGAEMMQFVRQPSFPKHEMGVIALVPALSAKRAVDMLLLGVNEILVLPLSPAALFARIDGILNFPRPFLRTERYFGPAPRPKMLGYENFARSIGMEEQRALPAAKH